MQVAGNGRRSIRCGAAFALVVGLWCVVPAGAAQTPNSCINCHSAQTTERLRQPAIRYPDDIHAAKNVSCTDCHGGDASRGFTENDPRLAHSRSKGYRGAPRPEAIPELCARCHSDVEYMKNYSPKLRVDQLLEYRSSYHGKALAKGDEKVATCTSCHGVHGILPASDTRSPTYKTNVAATCARCHADPDRMAPYGIPTDQLALYSASIHGRKLLEEGDLAAPTCNSCHGNHGATPPGLTSTSEVCGECHANNRDFFNQSPHKDAYAEMEIGECVTCHGHHDIQHLTDDKVGVSSESLCIECHAEGEPGYQTAAGIAAGLDSLKTMLAIAHERLERAERGGVDVALGKFDLHAADDALIKARTAVHYFNPEKFNEVISAGLTETENVIGHGDAALWDLKLRRIGLAFAIPLILFVALMLVFKIRQIERRKPIP
ncbi:MAG TPA: cytochrome c3 family protein [Acidobacteriota bacterium]|nr:cytochrome c3 family protein [Acidobacteriota bacterium]